MKKKEFSEQFAGRLLSQLKEKGYSSNKKNSILGVQIAKIAAEVACSPDMMRRYLNADVIPDYHTVFLLAKILNVPAGWLLFGEQASITGAFDTCDYITIKEGLLRYIIDNSAHPFVSSISQLQQISEFIVCLLKMATKINGDEVTKKILIDAAISSASILQNNASSEVDRKYGV